MVTNKYYEFVETCDCLSLEAAKMQLRIEADFIEDDVLIQSYIDASKQACANQINRSLDRRLFIMEANDFCNIDFELNADNDTVDKVEYYAPGETVLTLMDPADYKLVSGCVIGTKSIKFINKPALDNRCDSVVVTVNQGFDDDKVPTPVIQAMKLMLSDMYERREDRDIGNNSAANSLLRAYRKW